jgi:hypothetical protein
MLRGEYRRSITAFTVTFASGSAVSEPFSVAQYALGIVWLPSAFTGLALGAQVATAGGAFVNLADFENGYGTDVSCTLPTSQLVASHSCPTPGYWFAASQVKLLAHNLSGSGIPQTSARSCTLVLKP